MCITPVDTERHTRQTSSSSSSKAAAPIESNGEGSGKVEVGQQQQKGRRAEAAGWKEGRKMKTNDANENKGVLASGWKIMCNRPAAAENMVRKG